MVFHGTFETHPAIFTPFGHAETAFFASETPHRITDSITVAAIGACHFLCQMAFETQVIGALGTHPAAVIAEAALLTKINIIAANTASPTMVAGFYRTVNAPGTISAKVTVGFAFSAFSTMMIIAAAVTGCAMTPVVTEPIIISPRTAIFTILPILIVRKDGDRKDTGQHQ